VRLTELKASVARMSAATSGAALSTDYNSLRISLRSCGLRPLGLRNERISFYSCVIPKMLFWRQVWQPAHTLGLKRVVARERAALFTDLPQMRVEH
jgi:hypothetical protein